MTTTSQYRYGVLRRPPNFSTVPQGFVSIEPAPSDGAPHHDVAPFGVVVYSTPLALDDVRRFELVCLLEIEEAKAVAAEVASQMAEYAEDYVRMDVEDPSAVRTTVQNFLQQIRDVPVSVPSMADFTRWVMDHLRKAAGRG